MKIWFIGQGFLWGNYADDFERRWHEVVRYSKTKFALNKKRLKDCEVVIVGVPTPTLNGMFQSSILYDAIKATHPWQYIIIKSTVQVWTTDALQELYDDRFFIHSAEFLTEANAPHDVAFPSRNVFGMADKRREVMDQYIDLIVKLFPEAETIICSAKESEMGKYMSNFLLTGKIIMANIIYDMCQSMGIDYSMPKRIAGFDPRIWMSHLDVMHGGKRWAVGHCFPKDLEALFEMYSACMNGKGFGSVLLQMMSLYNLYIALETNKEPEILKDVYGTLKVQDVLALIAKECSETTQKLSHDSLPESSIEQ